ncbi:increased DNA methylation 3-like [Pyrus x bretschneideri]|uniref:increased DNA methylation 3-like n=1 Tax=Pyrus x bretschneideri TaxID=225117 RepID=UPI00202E2A89|nr:increased DNA methylation 3-like [Pyrus x bretschneideri]
MRAENVGNRRPHSEESGVAFTGKAIAKEGNGGVVDIGESEAAYLARVALAGLRTNRVNVVQDANLSDQVGSSRVQQLCPPGPFAVSFSLPGPVDPRLFSPHFQHDGLLEIVVLKSSKFSKK